MCKNFYNLSYEKVGKHANNSISCQTNKLHYKIKNSATKLQERLIPIEGSWDHRKFFKKKRKKKDS